VQASLVAPLAIGAGAALEATVGALLTRRILADPRATFAEVMPVFRFVASALLAATLSASVAVVALGLAGVVSSLESAATWLTWWLGDATGIMIVAPLIVSWIRPSRIAWNGWRVLELASLAVLLVAAAGELFTGWLLELESLPVSFMLVPFVIWAAIRFTEREVLTLCVIVSAIAIWATVTGSGPFAARSLNQSLLLQQAFVATLLVTGLALAALVQEQRRMRETLQRAHGEMEQIVHAAAHDLQEPLRTVIGYADLLQLRHRERLDADGLEILRTIVAGATRARQLFEDLLAVSETGRRPLALEPTSGSQALAAALGHLKGAIEESGARVTHDALPQVRADRRMLESLFQNLVGNSLKYRSSEPPRIHVSARREGGDWVFSVRDNGIGIDPRYHDVVFRTFERLNRDDARPGTGVGLALCKRIVERHGGRIWVESTASQGATIHFSIPWGGERGGRGGSDGSD